MHKINSLHHSCTPHSNHWSLSLRPRVLSRQTRSLWCQVLISFIHYSFKSLNFCFVLVPILFTFAFEWSFSGPESFNSPCQSAEDSNVTNLPPHQLKSLYQVCFVFLWRHISEYSSLSSHCNHVKCRGSLFLESLNAEQWFLNA